MLLTGILDIVAGNSIGVWLRDCWEFWAGESIFCRTSVEFEDIYIIDIESIDLAAEVESSNKDALVICADCFYVAPSNGPVDGVPIAKRKKRWVCLEPEELARCFPGLKAMVDTGVAIGCTSEQIIASWQKQHVEVSTPSVTGEILPTML